MVPSVVAAAVTATAMVTAPAARNSRVDTSPRGASRDRPQTPWPDVQPLASRVPMPTSSPARMITTGFVVTCVSTTR